MGRADLTSGTYKGKAKDSVRLPGESSVLNIIVFTSTLAVWKKLDGTDVVTIILTGQTRKGKHSVLLL